MDENAQSGEPDATDDGDKRVMGLLSEHVPLSLLVDLADPKGPDSDEILKQEGLPDDAWWVQEGVDLTAADEQPTDDQPADDQPAEDDADRA